MENFRLFTSREYEPELDLYYYRSRYYDAKIGKFTSRDPLLYVDGPNVYSYVNNNPVNYVDPWGLEKELHLSFGEYLKSEWNDVVNNFKELGNGAIYGDYMENPSLVATIGQIIGGEMPVMSLAADTRDVVASIQQCDGLNKECAINVGLNMAGFAPFLGSAKHIKHVDKLKYVDEISSVTKSSEKITNITYTVNKSANKINHIFNNSIHNHNLEDLVNYFGNSSKAFNFIANDVLKHVKKAGIQGEFQLIKNINKKNYVIRGFVTDSGRIDINTIFLSL